MPVRRYPNTEDQLTRNGAYVTQFGALETTEQDVQVYIQGRYGPLELRETALQLDGSALNNATAARDGAVTKISSGTTANDSIRLQSNRKLNYAPGLVAEHSCFIYRSGTVDNDLAWGFGPHNGDDGMFIRENASGVEFVLRNNGTNTVLDESVEGVTLFETIDADLLDKGRVWFIRFSFYGGNRIEWGLKETQNADPNDQGAPLRYFGVYKPTDDTNLVSTYMQTANLPSRVFMDNGATPPNSSVDVFTNDRQMSTFGTLRTNPRILTQQFVFDVDDAAPDSLIAFRPVQTFQGRENDVNIRLREVRFDSMDSANDVDIESWIGATDTGSTFSDSRYSAPQSALEIASGANVSVDTTGAVPVPPLRKLQSGNANNDPDVGVSDSDQVLGDEQIFYIEGQAAGSGTNTVVIDLIWEESH